MGKHNGNLDLQKAGYRTIPFGNMLAEMLKRIKKAQIENQFKI